MCLFTVVPAHDGSLAFPHPPKPVWHFFPQNSWMQSQGRSDGIEMYLRTSVVPQKPNSLQQTFNGHLDLSARAYCPHSALTLISNSKHRFQEPPTFASQLDKHLPVPHSSGEYPHCHRGLVEDLTMVHSLATYHARLSKG